MKNSDMPAMPTKGEIKRDSGEVWDYQVGDNDEYQFVGMTKREEFAKFLVAGMLPMMRVHEPEVRGVIARNAVLMADALLEELERK